MEKDSLNMLTTHSLIVDCSSERFFVYKKVLCACSLKLVKT